MARTMSLTRDFTSNVPASRDSYGSAATSRPSSSGFISRPRRHTDTDGSQPLAPRRKSSSNLLDPATPSSYYQDDYFGGAQDDKFLADGVRRSQREDDLASLIDFLKNQAPPSDNFMSIPEHDERGRWSKIKKISKRSKSMPRPCQIRLPDSAVSGTTTGGHRHIAISIPFDASPFGIMPRTQYPVFGGEEGKMSNATRPSPVHTFTNEKGVVTVLRTVNEDREPASPTNPLGSHPPMPWANTHRTSGSMGRSSISTGHRSRNSANSRFQEHLGSSSGSFRTPIFDQYRTKETSGDHQRAASSGTQSSRTFQRDAYPARGSSMGAGTGSPAVVIHPTRSSIDGVISPAGSVKTPGERSRQRTPSPGVEGGEQLVAKDGQQAKSRKVPKPLFFGENVSMGGLIKERNDRLMPHTPALAESPLLPPNDESGPPTPKGTRSRRDIVRDRKRRDIQTMRNSKQRQQEEEQYSQEQKTEEQRKMQQQLDDQDKELESSINGQAELEAVGQPETEGDASNRFSSATVKRLSAATAIYSPRDSYTEKRKLEIQEEDASASQPTLAPIMVVVDMEPDYSAEGDQPLNDDRPLPVAQSFEDFATARGSATDTSALTPPLSGDESQPQKGRSLDDRTSLSRRREWNAIREQERKTREAKEEARTKAKQLVAAGMSYDQVMASQTDKEILRLYEAYRDHRLREMERRVRRLERNGDVWLRALIPVLDNVNRNMSGGREDGGRAYASDDERAAGTERQSSSRRSQASRKGEGRRASLSQGRLMDELARKAREADARGESRGSRGSSGSDDTTGLGNIEPLMRELAGEARRRQRTAERLGVAADGRIFHAM